MSEIPPYEPPPPPQYSPNGGSPSYQNPYSSAPSYASSSSGQQKNWMGILSLVLALTGFSLVGIVFGHMALKAVERGEADNKGLAQAGTITSWIFFGIAFLFWLFFIGVAIFAPEASYSTQY